MKSFSNETLNFLQKVLGFLHFGSCQNCMSSANLVGKIHWKLWNKRVLSAGEPCTCKYVTFHQSFYRGTLSIHWYIAQNFKPTFLKVALATSNFMKEVYNSGFASEFGVSMLK